MSTLFAFLLVGFLMALPVLLVSIIVKAIMKKPVKKTALTMLGCFIGMIVSAMIFSETEPQLNCEHEFAVVESVSATCTANGKTVQKCPKCNKETEEVLPMLAHTWKEADCDNPKTCQVCETTEGEKGGHKWIEATCVSPKTCQVCETTEGEKSGHKWTNATCTNPKTCSSCGLTEGKALSADKSHSWKAATCTNPKTCKICNITEGAAIDHTPSKWKVIDEGTTETQGTRQQTCVDCGTVIQTEKFDSLSKVATEIIKKVVAEYAADAELEVVVGDKANSITVTGAIYCENDEQIVKNILSASAEKLKNVDGTVACVFAIGDIAKGKEGECLAMASLDADGNYNIASMSVNFKTERNKWITSQFSVWDGSHTVLKSLIKNNLNDEASFKHIKTTYIDVATKDKKKQVNDILKKAGYSQRVEEGDLFVMTEFSAKNAFNATVKNTAFGIVDYSADTVKLIGFE